MKGVALKVVTRSVALGSVLRGVALNFVTGTAVPKSITRRHGVQRPKHRPLQHTLPRGATPRRPGQRPGAGTTNGAIGHENNAAKRARGPRTRSTTARVK